MRKIAPFSRFEKDFNRLFQTVSEAKKDLTTMAEDTVSCLATKALHEGFFEFCNDQYHAIRELHPTLVKGKKSGEIRSGNDINTSFRLLVRRNLISRAESNRLKAMSRSCDLNPLRLNTGKDSRLNWSDTAEFLFDLAVKITRATGIAAKRALDPKKKNHGKVTAIVDRLLTGQFDILA